MSPEQIREQLLQALGAVAPEVDLGAIRPDELLRRQVDLDSVDWLNFLVEVKQRLGVDIPDEQVRRLATLAQLQAYCAQHRAPS